MSVTINRVYTKTGDGGRTRLAGGQEIAKDSARLEAYGTIDELNAVLGIVVEALASARHAVMRQRTQRIQNELFDLGGELATLAVDRHPKQALVTEADIERLEAEIDEVNGALPVLRSFILPGGGMPSAQLHHARTVCRRAERRLVTMLSEVDERPETLRYLNRLSDWLFVMGRKAACDERRGEVMWRPGER